jgi:hypothetical protein
MLPPRMALSILVFAAAAILRCEAGALSNVSITLSSYVANATGVSLTVTFRIASESANVSLSHINFASARTVFGGGDSLSCTCTNLHPYDSNVTASRVDNSQKQLLISLSPAAKPVDIVPLLPVTCVIGSFRNPPNSTGSAPGANVSTLSSDGAIIDEKTSVEIPAYFSESSPFASLRISPNVMGVRANVSFSFRSSDRNANALFKTISISGLRFSSYDPSMSMSCTGLDSNGISSVYVARANYSSESGVFLIDLSSSASAPAGLNCTTDGFTNPTSLQHCSRYRLDLPTSFCFGTVPSATFADLIPVHYMLDDRLGT